LDTFNLQVLHFDKIPLRPIPRSDIDNRRNEAIRKEIYIHKASHEQAPNPNEHNHPQKPTILFPALNPLLHLLHLRVEAEEDDGEEQVELLDEEERGEESPELALGEGVGGGVEYMEGGDEILGEEKGE
jgi:hypothetical protein